MPVRSTSISKEVAKKLLSIPKNTELVSYSSYNRLSRNLNLSTSRLLTIFATYFFQIDTLKKVITQKHNREEGGIQFHTMSGESISLKFIPKKDFYDRLQDRTGFTHAIILEEDKFSCFELESHKEIFREGCDTGIKEETLELLKTVETKLLMEELSRRLGILT